MKNKVLKTFALTTATVALAGSLQAIPITGVIGFAGTANVDSAHANTSTEVVSWGNNKIGLTSGTFASLDSAAVVALASPWFFDSSTLNNFWVVTDGAVRYTFDLASSSIISTSASSITIGLIGTVLSNVVGLDATVFTGNLTLQDPSADNGNGTYKYTESLSFGSVPDGGTTALLLGASLCGMALIRRKITPRTI